MSTGKREKNRWEKEVLEKSRARSPERQARFATSSGIEIEPLYGPDAAPEQSYLDRLGFPGEYPFTRGTQATMYRGRFWTMRQYAGFGGAEEANQRYHYLLRSGQTGLSVAFDLPTQMGLDADHPRAKGEVGKVGVAISSLADMEVLLKGIPLAQVSTSMTINATAAILLCAKRIPRWNPISISGYHIREAGSTAAQEIAFTLADGIAYVEAALKAGLELDAFAARLSFFFNVHNHLLEEVAKFRAARRLWSRIMKERFKAKDPRSMMLRFHAQTAGSTLTAQQTDNNVVRVALQALAAVLGGCQSLHTNSRDEALALPSEQAARLALRTQQILAHESGVADTVDPLGGAYAIERLTDELEGKAEAYLSKVDAMGGMVEAIGRGYPQREIEDAAFAAQREIEQGQSVVVGVNAFQIEEPPPSGLLRVDEAVASRQKERLASLRSRRDQERVNRSLDSLRTAAKGQENLIPHIFASVKALATLGEISDALREVFGEQREQVAT